MRTGIAIALWLTLAGCGDSSVPPVDVCRVAQASVSGTVEIGKGAGGYAPVAAGDPVQMELGFQGLYMFVLSARASGMEIDDGGTAAVWYQAVGAGGEALSLEFGCREREFAVSDAGELEMTAPFYLPVYPQYSTDLMDRPVKLQLQIRDAMGNESSSQVDVVAKLPP